MCVLYYTSCKKLLPAKQDFSLQTYPLQNSSIAGQLQTIIDVLAGYHWKCTYGYITIGITSC